jgi:hypothetical protein
MSDTVRSYGFIGVLKSPVTIDLEELSERLWDAGSDLDITYAGGLAYIDFNRHANYCTRTNIYGLTFSGTTPKGSPTMLIDEAAKYGLEIDPATIRSFNCIWWNGSDNPVSMLKKDDFLIQTKQKD